MPKKACCCDPKGRHVAVACRYYGGHALRYVLDGATASAGFSGSSGAPRYVGPDGFTIKNSGYQRLFGLTTGVPAFAEPSGVLIRGPYQWNVDIKQFDSTRDVVLLTRSGGGSSQYDWNDPNDPPKGGHSALLQTRVKASLNIEGFVGAGGTGFGGGQGSAVGELLNNPFNPNTVAGGGAGGGVLGRGGHGGITNGITGFGSEGGGAGSQNAGGCAGGIGACSGTEFLGGTGASDSGWGGGGRYSGGGGASKSGGGGAASKWPSSLPNFSDINYSEPGSDRGPGGICDPFMVYYNVVGDITSTVHAGMGGGANLVPDPVLNPGPGSPTSFVGFANDYNPLKEGIPGIVRAVWVDKYCPCDENKTDLPDKMYVCLTDSQYSVIQEFLENNPDEFNLPKFELDGETYIYFGICQNAYCSTMRLVDGDPINLRFTSLVQNVNGILMNDCCKTIIASPVCKIQTPNCYDCNNCYACVTSLKLKYCCEDVDDKPDLYWSIYEGYLWQAVKTNFWFPFGKKPEDTLSAAVIREIGPELGSNPFFAAAAANGFEKACLNVDGTGPAQNVAAELCDGISEDGDCDIYILPSTSNDHPCKINVGDWWEYPHPQFLPLAITISATICGKYETRFEPIHISFPNPFGCDCIDGYPVCLPGKALNGCLEPNEVTVRYNSFCSVTPTIISGSFADCSNLNNSSFITYSNGGGGELTDYMNPILGMTITIPKCPGTNTPVTTGVSLTSMCGRSIKVLSGFGLNLGTIASVMNNNPFGIIYQANEADIFITERRGALICQELEGFSVPSPPADVFVEMVETNTPTSIIQRYYYKPRTYLYALQLNANGPGGANTLACNGAPCECNTPYYIGQSISSTKNCIWGYYNLVTMKEPIFMNGVIDEGRGTCSIPPGLKSQINGTIPSSFFTPMAQSTEIADCYEYQDTCGSVLVGRSITCTGKVFGSVG